MNINASGVSHRQEQLLSLLLHHKEGLTIDSLARSLDISRTAVQQHIISLEGKGYIGKSSMTKTGGRPVQTYRLTELGIQVFPKQYAWFSELLLTELKRELSSEGLERYLRKLGEKTADNFRSRLDGKSTEDRVHEVIRMMRELGYEASLGTASSTQTPTINACNCVYHALAKENNEICAFDIALISSLLQRDIQHVKCMARGDLICSFKTGDLKS